MKCTHCGKEIEQSSYVKIDQNYFCDNLCKYSYHKKGEKQQEDVDSNTQPLPENLKFQIDYPNFNSKELVVRGSYYGRPKLFLDGKKVKSITRNIFSRKRKYKIEDDNGIPVDILLSQRWLDAIPHLEIDGNKIIIRGALKWYEYLWIIIPIILLFIGGGIGGLIGSIGTLTNSILFRKFTSPFAKYLVTGVNTLVAFILFFKMLFFILPGFEELKFHYGQFNEIEVSKMTEEQRSRFDILTNTPWLLTEVTDIKGNAADLSNLTIRNSRKYFYKDGSYSQFLVDDSYIVGSWEFDENYETITFKFSDGVVSVQIVKLDDDELIYVYNNLEVTKHVPYEFDYWGWF